MQQTEVKPTPVDKFSKIKENIVFKMNIQDHLEETSLVISLFYC